MKIHYHLAPLSFEERMFYQDILLDVLDRQAWFEIRIIGGKWEVLICTQ